jgi:hypothetical protein
MHKINSTQKYKFLFYVEQNYSFDILRPLQELAVLSGFEVCWFLTGADICPSFLMDSEIQLHSVGECIDYKPDAVFAPGDRVPGFIPGLKVQVFHGLNESKRGNKYPERGLFDLYCTEGPERTKTLQEITESKGYFHVRETGWVKLDSLLQFKTEAKYPRPQILFASTFSPSLSSAENAYDTIKKLSKGGQWQWIITLHPKMAKETIAKYRALENENLIFYGNDKVIEALHRADIMIGDNSSIFQEFLLLNKPVITINNRSPLDCFINITSVNDLEKAIHSALSPSNSLKARIKEYGPSVTPYLDGNSSTRVLDEVIRLLENNWQDKKPKNIFRNFKMRQKLNYWKW